MEARSLWLLASYPSDVTWTEWWNSPEQKWVRHQEQATQYFTMPTYPQTLGGREAVPWVYSVTEYSALVRRSNLQNLAWYWSKHNSMTEYGPDTAWFMHPQPGDRREAYISVSEARRADNHEEQKVSNTPDMPDHDSITSLVRGIMTTEEIEACRDGRARFVGEHLGQEWREWAMSLGNTTQMFLITVQITNQGEIDTDHVYSALDNNTYFDDLRVVEVHKERTQIPTHAVGQIEDRLVERFKAMERLGW
jgi:hypothetical protein